MRKRLGKFCKLSIAVICCWLSLNLNAQEVADTLFITETVSDFDPTIVPAQNIYGTSWDAENVDSPEYDAERMSWGYLITLVDSTSEFYHPFQGKINSKYGWRRNRWHKGIDIDLDIGDPVHAAFDGVIRIQRYNAGGYGNYVLIRHNNGLETIYGHLSQALVVRNQVVKAGDVIGFGGSTGRSTGPHLHFETRLMGQAFDPAKIIDFTDFRLLGPQAFINHTWFPYIKGSNPKANVAPASAKKYHRVRKGDTLYGLSRRYGVSVNRICKLNRMSRNSTLRIGRNVRVK